MAGDPELYEYLLRLGDTCLILSQQLSAWCGHGPELEEDLALANVALDLLGQARLWLTYAGQTEGAGRDEDALAYRRSPREFRSLLLVEQPNGDFGDTMARQFYFDAWHVLILRQLGASADPQIRAIAAKALKEATYHLRRSTDWIVRLGDGTEESRRRIGRSLHWHWRYTGELFERDALDETLIRRGVGVDLVGLSEAWLATVVAAFARATLELPKPGWMQSGGRRGLHSEGFGYVLDEMQSLQRSLPGLQW